MLLFGGNLIGTQQIPSQQLISVHTNDGKNVGDVSVAASHGNTKSVEHHTPHTELLHRLTNHELRLLDELERTRSKLQTEWKLKVKAMQKQKKCVFVKKRARNVDDQLTQIFGNQNTSLGKPRQDGLNSIGLEALKRAKSIFPPPTNTKYAVVSEEKYGIKRASINFLPALTTQGGSPLDRGLSNVNMRATSNHILPIFRLPSIIAAEQAENLTEIESKQSLDIENRKDCCETLNLSEEEVNFLELSLARKQYNKGTIQGQSGSTPLNIELASQSNNSEHEASALTTASKLTKKDVINNSGWTQTFSAKVSKQRKTKHKGKTKAKVEAHTDTLKKELVMALSNVQHYTKMVRQDLSTAQQICPVPELRSSQFFKRWGKAKIEGIARRLLYNLQYAGMMKWKKYVAFLLQEQKEQAFSLYKGSKRLELMLMSSKHRKVQCAWRKWADFVNELKMLELKKVQLDAIEVITRAWKCYKSRLLFFIVNRQRQAAKEAHAATKIQQMFRARIARLFLRFKRDLRRKVNAAIKIQCLGRGNIGRWKAHQLKQGRMHEHAARRAQGMYRRWKTRKIGRVVRQNIKRIRAAVTIQRSYRGHLGRAKYIQMQVERHHWTLATKIQTVARGKLARKQFGLLHQADKEERVRRYRAATYIQCVYRGHRSRLATDIKLIALRARNKQLYQSAVKIQLLFRCCYARMKVRKLRHARGERFIAQAKQWVELWHEESQTWYYYCEESEGALWMPPATGYTKYDGTLVLQNGEVVSGDKIDNLDGKVSSQFGRQTAIDSTVEKAETSDAEDSVDQLCVECEEFDAIKYCDQCEDNYCYNCFTKLHNSEKRESHTWKAIGTMRCIECEKMKATRWCVVCEDPYCLGCFTIIHLKGNKANHEYTDMKMYHLNQKSKTLELQPPLSVITENAQTYNEFMVSDEYQYVTQYPEKEGTNEYISESYNHDTYNEPNVVEYDATDYDNTNYNAYNEQNITEYNATYFNNSNYDTYNEQNAKEYYNSNSNYSQQGNTYTEYANSDQTTNYMYDENLSGVEWTTLVDETTGRMYYYNTVTGESQWVDEL